MSKLKPKYVVKAYAVVNDESGRVILNSLDSQLHLFLTKRAALQNIRYDQRVVKVEITER